MRIGRAKGSSDSAVVLLRVGGAALRVKAG